MQTDSHSQGEAQSIRERWGRCRTTLIDSSRLFPTIKLSWKINFCILCKLKYAILSWPLCLSCAQFTVFSVSFYLFSCFISELFCVFIHLSLLVYILCVMIFYSLKSLMYTDRRMVLSYNWLTWNAIMHQKPIVIKNHRTFIISIKTDCECQSHSSS